MDIEIEVAHDVKGAVVALGDAGEADDGPIFRIGPPRRAIGAGNLLRLPFHD